MSKIIKKSFFFCLLLIQTFAQSSEFYKDYENDQLQETSTNVANDLVYGEGTTEIDTEVSDYDTISANQPIHGTLFVTHNSNSKIDETSFQIGEKPLSVKFVQTTQMTLSSPIVVSIYNFELEGLPLGVHTLPSINVKVGGQVVQALPLVITVSKN